MPGEGWGCCCGKDWGRLMAMELGMLVCSSAARLVMVAAELALELGMEIWPGSKF